MKFLLSNYIPGKEGGTEEQAEDGEEEINLYGYAMRQYLPTGGFEWVYVTERENWAEFILQQQDEQEEGYFLEVDLEYPKELHDTFDNYPCVPEKMKINESYLSDHQKQLGEKCGGKI